MIKPYQMDCGSMELEHVRCMKHGTTCVSVCRVFLRRTIALLNDFAGLLDHPVAPHGVCSLCEAQDLIARLKEMDA